jgi:putative transposase
VAGLAKHDWIDLDGFYLGLGRSAAKRQKRYRQWIEKAVSDEESELIRQAARRNQLTGGGRFIDEIEKKLGKRIETRGRGRPLKEEK